MTASVPSKHAMQGHAHKTDSSHETEPVHRGAEWLARNGRNLLILIAIVGAMLIVGFRYYSGQRAGAEHDYLSAALYYEKLVSVSPLDKEALGGLVQIIDEHPELQSKYQGEVVHALIKDGDLDSGAALGEQALQRLGKELPTQFAAYAQASLMICRGELPKALSASRKLATDLEGDVVLAESVTLRTFNLLRIAMLEQAHGSGETEVLAWDQVELWLATVRSSGSPHAQEAMSNALRTLQEGAVTLEGYIQHRRQSLKA